MGCDGWTSNPEGFEVGTKLYLERTSLKNCVVIQQDLIDINSVPIIHN